MRFDINWNKNSKKKKIGDPLGLFSRRVVFLEILKLKNPCKIGSSLSNAITSERCETIKYKV